MLTGILLIVYWRRYDKGTAKNGPTTRRMELDSRELIERVRTVGLTYADYAAQMAAQASADPAGLPSEDAERIGYTKLNLHRSERIGRNWKPGPETTKVLDGIREPQLWMVLTEPWCGDSAQSLPVIAALAERDPDIELRIVLRDANLEIMDLFLTDGKRSIPRLVIFAAGGEVIGGWGPRPRAAQAAFDEAKAAGKEKPGILEALHLWYGRDRQRALEEELAGLLRSIGTR